MANSARTATVQKKISLTPGLTGSSSVSQRDDSPAFSSQFDGMLGQLPFPISLLATILLVPRQMQSGCAGIHRMAAEDERGLIWHQTSRDGTN